jgi:hypothetical protein
VSEKFEQWAWVVEEEDGKEGVIGVVYPGQTGISVLVTRSEILARGYFKDAADAHAEASGRPVRLVHLREVPS